ncbi:MAG: glycosyltransferase family 39 protein [Candidatus Omnitrophota bacterium]
MNYSNLRQKMDFSIIAAFICLLGFSLRIFMISRQSIWFDEAASLVSAIQPSLTAVIKTTIITERIPPLYPVFLHFWIKEFGFSEASIRFPSVIFGTLTVPLLYLFVKKFINFKIAVISSLLLAVSPIHIYFSQEARYVCVFIFLNLFSTILFYGMLKKESKIKFRDSCFYVFITCLAMYTNYLMVLSLFGQNIIYLLHNRINKVKMGIWIKGQFAIFLLCFLPLTFFLTSQVISVSQENSQDREKINLNLNYSQTTEPEKAMNKEDNFSNSKVNALLGIVRSRIKFQFLSTLKMGFFHAPFFLGSGIRYLNRVPYDWSPIFLNIVIIPSTLLFLALFLLGWLVCIKKNELYIVLLFFMPFTFILLIKLLGLRPIGVRHIAFLLPIFYLMITLALFNIEKKIIRFICSMLLVFFIVLSLSIYYFDQKTYKDDWRYLTSYVLKDLTADDYILFQGEYAHVPFRYYTKLLKKNNKNLAQNKIYSNTLQSADGSLERFLADKDKGELKNKKRIWLISYYALEEENQRLKTYFDGQYNCVEKNTNLGRNLSLLLYTAK